MTELLKLYFFFQYKKAQPKKLKIKEKSIGRFSANPGVKEQWYIFIWVEKCIREEIRKHLLMNDLFNSSQKKKKKLET